MINYTACPYYFHYGADITIPPRAYNVSIKAVAEFTCTAVASTFIWEANKVGITEEEGTAIMTIALNEAQSIRMSTLRIKVTTTDNAVNITCIAVSLSPFTSEESIPVLLLVQGEFAAYLFVTGRYTYRSVRGSQ